jgi:hypothetical protein
MGAKGFKSRARSERLRGRILDLLRLKGTPMTNDEISYHIESKTSYRCSVRHVSSILRPQVADGTVIKSPRSTNGERRRTYELRQ